MKKIIVALALVVVSAVAVANRPVVLSELESLAALDRAESHDGMRSAFQTINESALHVLPTAATLRAENAIASIVLSTTNEQQVAAR